MIDAAALADPTRQDQLPPLPGGGGGKKNAGGIPKLGWAGTFDLVTSFDAIHDLVDPAGALRAAKALVKQPSSRSAGGG